MNVINLLVLLFTIHIAVEVKCDETEDFGYGPLSIEDLMASLDVNDTVDNELPDFSEADIDMRESVTRNSVSGRKLWPNCRVPYTIDRSRCLSGCRAVVEAAMSEIHAASGVRFVPQTSSDNYYVRITDEGNGCYSHVGMTRSSQQIVSLDQQGCIVKGIVMHELMHSLGFFHEQSRMDRDQYITVNMENVQQSYRDQFNKVIGDTYGLSYDYGSLMHYGTYSFSRNSGQLKTIETPYGAPRIGQRVQLSELDKKRINKAYTSCQITNGGGSTSNTNCRNLPDYDSFCDTWSRMGLCNDIRYQSFLKKHCFKACKHCTNQAIPNGGTNNNCRDTGPTSDCQIHLSYGRCTDYNYRQSMQASCAKTCNLCGNTQNCNDLHATSECQNFRNQGLCQQSQYRQTLEKYCKNTCGFC